WVGTTAATNAEQRSCEPCQWGARADAYAEPQTGRFNKGWRTTMSSTTDKPALYERLGGFYSIAAVVDDFIDRVMNNPILNANPAVDEAHHRVSTAGFKYYVTEMVRWATGGPQNYTGRSMLESHKHLKIPRMSGPLLSILRVDDLRSLEPFKDLTLCDEFSGADERMQDLLGGSRNVSNFVSEVVQNAV